MSQKLKQATVEVPAESSDVPDSDLNLEFMPQMEHRLCNIGYPQ